MFVVDTDVSNVGVKEALSQYGMDRTTVRCRVNDVLIELHGGLSRGHLGVNKNLDTVRHRHRLQSRNNVEKCCQQCDTCAAIQGP